MSRDEGWGNIESSAIGSRLGLCVCVGSWQGDRV